MTIKKDHGKNKISLEVFLIFELVISRFIKDASFRTYAKRSTRITADGKGKSRGL